MWNANHLLEEVSSPQEDAAGVRESGNPEADSGMEVVVEQPPVPWSMDFRQVLLIGGLCLLFLVSDFLPLPGGRMWGDVAIGEWILTHRIVPDGDPLIALVEGTPRIPSRWLSQVLLAGVGRLGSDELLAHLFAIVSVIGTLVLFDAARRYGGSFNTALAMVLLLTALSLPLPRLIGADLLGWLMLTCCLNLWSWEQQADGRHLRSWAAYGVTPLLMMLWANLHPSFVAGLAIFGCSLMGAGWSLALARDDTSRSIHSRQFFRWLWLTELACLGTLCNPAGIDLLLDQFGLLTLVHDSFVRGRQPLIIDSWAALPVFACLLLAAVLVRRTPLRIPPTDVGLAWVFGCWGVLDVTMLKFSLPVLMLVATPHVAKLLGVFVRATSIRSIQASYGLLFTRSILLTSVALLAVWMAFMISPLSRTVLGGKSRLPRQYLRSDIPLEATAFLLKSPVTGMIATPADWGDWLLARGPESVSVMLDMDSEGSAPRQVRQDFRFLMDGRPGVDRILERYRIQAVLADSHRQRSLIEQMDQLAGWKRVYEDSRASLYLRAGDAPAETEGTTGESTREESET